MENTRNGGYRFEAALYVLSLKIAKIAKRINPDATEEEIAKAKEEIEVCLEERKKVYRFDKATIDKYNTREEIEDAQN